ncbi:GbsR/MarR family transcriptional regulator [Cellulomonas endometrii]|uniref:GbsR/MarR family transcriptional regulator n=1 Tax=Cellulomonas endometrii TaxID=3036301 RepID=UPI0024AE3A82|nr:MarR family transcriptional regulator [Cellulomonas endometrii]
MTDAGTPPPATPSPAPAEPALDADAREWIEQFASTWDNANSARMEGRVVGLLMIVDRPYLSSAQIASLLVASAGAVSTATRRLVEIGFIMRHSIPGDRNHYFRVEDDIWGSWLASERTYLPRLQRVIDSGLVAVSDDDPGPRRRLLNARNYFEWLAGYHRKMLAEWEAHRDALAAAEDEAERAGQPPAGTGAP